jgi:hypothetical protein
VCLCGRMDTVLMSIRACHMCVCFGVERLVLRVASAEQGHSVLGAGHNIFRHAHQAPRPRSPPHVDDGAGCVSQHGYLGHWFAPQSSSLSLCPSVLSVSRLMSSE